MDSMILIDSTILAYNFLLLQTQLAHTIAFKAHVPLPTIHKRAAVDVEHKP